MSDRPMAAVFRPNQQQMMALGYQSIAAVPVLFDSAHRYLREYNWHLRERALLEWTPNGESAADKSLTARRVRYLTPESLKTYAHGLKNWVEWTEAHGLDWRAVEYEKHVLRYRDDMLSGRWSRDGERLQVQTAELRVDRVTEFLTWAAERGLRPPFVVPRFTTYRTFSTGESSQPSSREISYRAGRHRKNPMHLRLPTREEIGEWVRLVRTKRGFTKALACRTALELALRKRELVSLRADVLDPDPSKWEIVGENVILHITDGTKGGKARYINCPLDLAHELLRYIKGRRLKARAKWLKNNRGQRPSALLFLSEFDGSPLSYDRFYEAWTCYRIYVGWSPHLGRHVWACFTLLDILAQEARKTKETLDRLPESWIYSAGESVIKLHIRPQLGHTDDSTCEIYLRWITNHLTLVSHYESWHSFMKGNIRV